MFKLQSQIVRNFDMSLLSPVESSSMTAVGGGGLLLDNLQIWKRSHVSDTPEQYITLFPIHIDAVL